MKAILLILLSVCSMAFADLKYNPMTEEWEITGPEARLRYNPMTEKWTHAPEDEHLEYNPMDDTWEFPGESWRIEGQDTTLPIYWQ